MTNRPTKLVKCAGGEESLGLPPCGHCGEELVVELTDSEIAERETLASAFQAEREAAEAEEALKASADAKLTAFYESIGLTPDEIASKL